MPPTPSIASISVIAAQDNNVRLPLTPTISSRDAGTTGGDEHAAVNDARTRNRGWYTDFMGRPL
jgi:hypothetical protein